MNLVIVESPAKAKTIEKYLGRGYKVLASFGNIRDLPVSELGVDTDNDFKPSYRITGRKDLVSRLKEESKKAKKVILATDLDREGEAIAWHLSEALKLPKSKTERVTFHEITESAIKSAFNSPREINLNLVDAQTARRILDRLVGYKLSPFLWQKIRKGLSAGRVQSVAVRLIVEREAEIKAFKPAEYWSIRAKLSPNEKSAAFLADLFKVGDKKIDKLFVKNEKQAKEIEKTLSKAAWTVSDINSKPSKRVPAPPFITSTMQQEAARKLRFSAKQTMLLSQNLYEAGFITYMRTDSLNLSESAISEARQEIEKRYGKEYVAASPRRYKAKVRGAQEAHEAIRPTRFSKLPEEINLGDREKRLYELIWQRAVASQMAEAKIKLTEALILAKEYTFRAVGEEVLFPGFLKLYFESEDDETAAPSGTTILPRMKVSDKLNLLKLLVEQRFTEPPPRYTEATLIKALEKEGIGRPSTYAPILSTIQERGYVKLVDRKFYPEEIGEVVTKILKEHFADVVDYKFTAEMEDKLDDVADGKKKWVPMIREFYNPFQKRLLEKSREVKKDEFIEETGEECPKCKQGKLVIRFGRYGKFISCSRFPECDYTSALTEDGKEKKEPEVVGKCPECGADLVERRSRFGKFIGCTNYPKCKYIKNGQQSVVGKCPDCGADLVTKRTKRGKIFYGCSGYPKCKYATWEKPVAPK